MHARMLPPLGLRDLLLKSREMPRSPMYVCRSRADRPNMDAKFTHSGFVQGFRKLEYRWGRETTASKNRSVFLRGHELASIGCEKSRRFSEYENTAAEVHLPPSRTPRTFVRSDAPRLEGGRRRGKAAILNKGILYKKNGMAYGGGRSKRCDLPLAHSLPLPRPAKSMNLLHQFVRQQSSSRLSWPRLPALDAIARFYTPAIYISPSSSPSPGPLF